MAHSIFNLHHYTAAAVENLELRDVILEIADDLYNDCKMTEYGDYYDPVWEAKYIEMTYPNVRERMQ